ncbi:amidohydrolase [Mycobacterium tuberculosis]|nr:amidohydrolase [Mycobacterium tuberculosis]
MRIALAQIRSGTDPAANLQLVGKYAGEADPGQTESDGSRPRRASP